MHGGALQHDRQIRPGPWTKNPAFQFLKNGARAPCCCLAARSHASRQGAHASAHASPPPECVPRKSSPASPWLFWLIQLYPSQSRPPGRTPWTQDIKGCIAGGRMQASLRLAYRLEHNANAFPPVLPKFAIAHQNPCSPHRGRAPCLAAAAGAYLLPVPDQQRVPPLQGSSCRQGSEHIGMASQNNPKCTLPHRLVPSNATPG